MPLVATALRLLPSIALSSVACSLLVNHETGVIVGKIRRNVRTNERVIFVRSKCFIEKGLLQNCLKDSLEKRLPEFPLTGYSFSESIFFKCNVIIGVFAV